MRDLVGRTIGNYTVLDPLNEGGVADVYRARSTLDGQIVALKVMKPEMLRTENLLDRFLREAHLTSALNHSHIVRIDDTGMYGQTPFIAMQYAEGGNLAEQVAQQPLALPDINILIAQIAAALDFAHAHNTIHRDIKMENILLDQQGNVLLTDFGMAKTLVTGGTLATAPGVMLGTPQYMSPEQCMGKTVDERSDVYSLGVLLFRLLTGEFPFDAAIPNAIIAKHIRENPPPVTSLKPGLPPALDAIVFKTLAKEPAERYQTAGELTQALQTALSQPVVVKAPGETRPATVTLSGSRAHATHPAKAPPTRLLLLIGAAILVIAVLFVLLLSNLPS